LCTAGFLIEVFFTAFGFFTAAVVVVVVLLVGLVAAGFWSARAEPASRIAAVIKVVIVFIAVLLVSFCLLLLEAVALAFLLIETDGMMKPA
jgi:hypothetical protein